MKDKLELSYRGRKALTVHVGEAAAAEIIDFLDGLAERVQKLEHGKVDVMQIVPTTPVKRDTVKLHKAA